MSSIRFQTRTIVIILQFHTRKCSFIACPNEFLRKIPLRNLNYFTSAIYRENDTDVKVHVKHYARVNGLNTLIYTDIHIDIYNSINM